MQSIYIKCICISLTCLTYIWYIYKGNCHSCYKQPIHVYCKQYILYIPATKLYCMWIYPSLIRSSTCDLYFVLFLRYINFKMEIMQTFAIYRLIHTVSYYSQPIQFATNKNKFFSRIFRFINNNVVFFFFWIFAGLFYKLNAWRCVMPLQWCVSFILHIACHIN